LKNPLEELIREGKGPPPPSIADAQPCLERGLERATNKKVTKNEKRWNLRKRRRDIGMQEMERKQGTYSRHEVVSRGLSREASLHKQGLFLLAMVHAAGCDPAMGVLRAH